VKRPLIVGEASTTLRADPDEVFDFVPFTNTANGLVFGSPIAGAARWFLEFESGFVCEPTVDGTKVTPR
jgi:hypothetical protein